MSTRGAIARLKGANEFCGVYHHWDSYPSGLGKTLFSLYREQFGKDLSKMLKVLIDEHPAGWSTINESDWDLSPGFIEYKSNDGGRPPECYCHGSRSEKGWKVNQKNASGSGVEWVYAFTDFEGVRFMHVLSSFCDPSGKFAGEKMIGAFGMGDPKAVWKMVACVDLDGQEPEWENIGK